MSWRGAESLMVLRSQIDRAYPNRSKISDGLIGNQAHAKTPSDHNPNQAGVVCAMDITNDPKNGFDAQVFVDLQRKNPHPNLKYMIFDKRIYSRLYGWNPRPSRGHESHVHVSVGVGADGHSRPAYDDRIDWMIKPDVPQVRYEVYEIKSSKLVKVQVQTGTNGSGYTDVKLPAGVEVSGQAWRGNGAKGLSVACEPVNGEVWRVAVDGAPGRNVISVNLTFSVI